jgi:hypothetical protein
MTEAGLELLEFDRVMNYAFRIASRHKREIALVMLGGEQKELRTRPMLTRFFRRSDEVAELHECAAVLLSETSAGGAQRAIQRYKSTDDRASRMAFSIASFPADGESAQVVFKTAIRRFGAACGTEPGTVVVNG